MRIATRIAAGLFLLVVLLSAALAYQLSLLGEVQGINRELSRTNLEAARGSVRLLQALEGVHEFAHKASALSDPDYHRQWEYWEGAVEDDILLLAEAGLSGDEDEIRKEIESGWEAYRAATRAPPGEPVPLDEVDRTLTVLWADVEELIAVNDRAVASRAEASTMAGDRARLVAWVITGVAFLVAGLLSLILYRSISGPLRNLTRGTRELARGRFDHRLGVEGPRELAELARDFNHMAARLDELEDLKRDFVSHVSHQLKTPLAAIQETIHALLDELPGPLAAKQVQILERSGRSAERLSSMISDLLDVSRLEAGASGYEPDFHDLGEIARSVLEDATPLALDRSLGLTLHMEPDRGTLLCDAERIREVVDNLVGNAMKFSSDGGSVSVTVSEEADFPRALPHPSASSIRGEDGPFVMLSVEDEGPGVPDAEKDRVFEKFHQVGRRERIQGQGVGLGLAIARRLVEAHSGAIWVEDGARGGSIFRILVPRIPSQWRKLSVIRTGARREWAEGFRSHPVAATGSRTALRSLLSIVSVISVSACAYLPGSETEPSPVDPVGFQLVSDRLHIQPEPTSGFRLVVPRFVEGLEDEVLFDFRRREPWSHDELLRGPVIRPPDIGREMRRLDPVAPGQNRGSLDDVPKLSHIARPTVALEHPHRLIPDGGRRNAMLSAEQLQKVLGEERDVPVPLPEGREIQRQDIQPVV